jgi:hypothetical protein
MRYIKLFENNDLPYEEISANDFLDQYNYNMINFNDDFNFIERFIKKIPNSLIERKEDKRITKSETRLIENINITFYNIRYSSIKIYRTETNYYSQIFEPKEDNNWEFNYYKIEDIWDVIQFIKDKLKLYEKHKRQTSYSLKESVFTGLKNKDESIEGLSKDKYYELKNYRIYLEDSMLGDKTVEFIFKRIKKIFNHEDFKFEHSLKHITIYENKNTTIAFYINLLEDDYYLVEFKPSSQSFFFLCDGVRGLLMLIKGQYEQFQKRVPRLYYEINKMAFDFPKNNLTIDGSDIQIWQKINTPKDLEKLQNFYLKDIKEVKIIKNKICIKSYWCFEIFYSNEYNWWLINYIKPDMHHFYYLCITMDGLRELIEDKIKTLT